MVDTGGQARHPAATERLMRFWTTGRGGVELIRWGDTAPPGDFARCKLHIQKAVTDGGKPPLPEHELDGLCRNLHVRALGVEPGHAPGEHRGGHQ